MSFYPVGAGFQQNDFEREGGYKRAVEEPTTLNPTAYQVLASQMLYIVAEHCPEINANDVVKPNDNDGEV